MYWLFSILKLPLSSEWDGPQSNWGEEREGRGWKFWEKKKKRKKLLLKKRLLSSDNTANLLNKKKGKNSMLISSSPLLEWEMECGNKVAASCIRT